jgi:hypothetical protein
VVPLINREASTDLGGHANLSRSFANNEEEHCPPLAASE